MKLGALMLLMTHQPHHRQPWRRTNHGGGAALKSDVVGSPLECVAWHFYTDLEGVGSM